MAKQSINVAQQCKELIEEIHKGIFRPVYLLMGEESYYPDLICKEIIDNCIDESNKDFNELICYGSDANAESVISAARQFPMMSDRVLVVLKEAQLMKSLESLSVYCEHPLESTTLVILMHGGGADKRKALYKSVSKNGVVVDSPLVRDYELARWIENYYQSLGLTLEPGGANLLAEYIGCNLGAIAVETDKLLKNIPLGCKEVSIDDIEKTDALKTGELIRAACVMGCIAAGRKDMIPAAEEYARCIGISFQIVDDILDVTSDEQTLGKPIGSDDENEKCTYVSLLGIERSKEIVSELTEKAKDALKEFDGNAEFLVDFADKMEKRKN